MSHHGTSERKELCSACGTELEVHGGGAKAPCPECGETSREIVVVRNDGIEVSDSIEATLARFVDHSSAETEAATTTALAEIALWVGETDRLTVKHIIDGNLTSTKAGVPVGPFDDDQGRKIVETVFSYAEEKRDRGWDRMKTYASLGLAAIAALIAYLKFVHE